MGIILDSSILIAAERGSVGVGEILKRVGAAHGETEAGLSAVTIVELTHGIYRAKTDADRKRRQSVLPPRNARIDSHDPRTYWQHSQNRRSWKMPRGHYPPGPVPN